MTTPTDEEIDAVVAPIAKWQFPAETRLRDYDRAIARAVLAKWGTPAGAEPFCWHWRHIKSGTRGVHYEHPEKFGMDLASPDYEWTTLYTSPQPQAGAVPLTDEWIRSRCKEPWIFDTAKQWVRIAEAAHGITEVGKHV